MIAPNNTPNDNSGNKKSPKKPKPLRSVKPPIAKVTEEDLQELLESVLSSEDIQEEILKDATKRLNTEQAVGTVKSLMSEYFSTFMILGYDVNGNRMIIKHTRTHRDEDSLMEMLRYVIMRMLGQN